MERKDTHLGLNQPRFRSFAGPRLVQVSRVHGNTPAPVVQGGKVILVLVALADPGWVLWLQGIIWGGFPEEKLGAWAFKGRHHLATSQPKAAGGDLQQNQQQWWHRGEDSKGWALAHLEVKCRQDKRKLVKPGVIFVLVAEKVPLKDQGENIFSSLG